MVHVPFPSDVAQALTGGALYADGDTALPFITVSADGWPHVAMASGAVLRSGQVAFPVRKKSRSWANMSERRLVTLIVCGRSTVAYIKGEAALTSGPSDRYDVCTLLNCRAEHDVPASAIIESGIRYSLAFDDLSESEERATFRYLVQEWAPNGG